MALQTDGFEEIVAFVIDQDEGGEVLDADFPDGLHSEFGILNALDAADAALGKHRGHSADGAEVEASVFEAGVGDCLGAVPLGYHNQGGAVVLEFIHIRVHTIGRGGAHRAAGHPLGSLGRTGIEDGMILEIGGHFFSGVKAGLQFSVGDIAGHDDGALQIDAGADCIAAELCTNGVDALVQVYLDALGTLAGAAELLWNKFGRIAVQLLDPYAVSVDLGLDIAVRAAADTHSDGAAGTVAGQAYDADVVGQVFAAELGAKADFLRLFQEFFLQVDVAESAAGLISRLS